VLKESSFNNWCLRIPNVGFREASDCARKVLEESSFNNAQDTARFHQVVEVEWKGTEGAEGNAGPGAEGSACFSLITTDF